MTKEILSFSEASEYTSISKSYLYKLTCGRKIPYSKPTGKLIFFLKEDLDKFLTSNRIATQEEINSRATAYCANNKKGGANV